VTIYSDAGTDGGVGTLRTPPPAGTDQAAVDLVAAVFLVGCLPDT
jgi:hypothetical protein